MRISLRCAIALFALVAVAPDQSRAQAKIVIGSGPGLAAAGPYIADAKGFFRDAGIDVDIENLASAADAMASLATNEFQVVEGGYSAGYWNALAKNFPIITAFERGSRPTNHKIVVPVGMKDTIKTVADLKGHSVAVNGPGSLTIYELGRMLEVSGLALKDVDVKYMPFPQMGIAFKNAAVDAAEDIPPFVNLGKDQGLMVEIGSIDDTLKPYPLASVAYQINTGWAAQNQDFARKFFVAL